MALKKTPDQHGQKVSEQIAKLEARHRALVEETAQELEALKQQITEGNDIKEQVAEAQQPLLAEIATLRSKAEQAEQEKRALTTELERLHKDYQGHYSQLQGALGSLKHVVQNQAQALDQQVKLLSVDTDQAITELLASINGAAATPTPVAVVEKAEPLPTVTDDSLEALLAEFSPAALVPTEPAVTVTEVPEEKVKPKREKKQRSFKGFKRFAIRAVAFALVVALGWGGLKAIQQKNQAEAGQVAGASTATTAATSSSPDGTQDPTQEYKESYAIVPFDKTEWASYTDPDFGISLRWPQNASNELKTPGGSNVWFLRFDAYYMRITLESTSDTLEDWWKKNSGFYTSDGSATKGTFKNRPAYIVTPTSTTGNVGTTYIFQTPKGIMQVWAKSFDPASDDGQRLAKMVDSFTIAAN